MSKEDWRDKISEAVRLQVQNDFRDHKYGDLGSHYGASWELIDIISHIEDEAFKRGQQSISLGGTVMLGKDVSFRFPTEWEEEDKMLKEKLKLDD